MHHETGHMLLGADFPQFLEAEAIGLWIAAVVQIEFFLQQLAEIAAAAFSENRVLGMQFHAARIAAGMLAMLADAHIAGGDALDAAFVAAVLGEQHFGSREARE